MISKLEDFKAYDLAMELGEEVWDVVIKWNTFEKDTLGKQFVRSADSIAANLSEGLGRYHFKEARNFSYYSRGSLFETKTWLTKAKTRSLIDTKQYETMMERLEVLGRMINGYINSIGQVNEPSAEYGSLPDA
ncbi:MAG: four helix bundle protein [Cyclobacteriaceae bacterium]